MEIRRLMKIPAMPLPSNAKRSVQFRVPLVEDCIEFCDVNEDFDEQLTTLYLRTLMTSEGADPLEWTGEDRRTALWWIAVHLADQEADLAYEYPCEHCGEWHQFAFDMRDLDKDLIRLKALPKINGSVEIDGKATGFFIEPLNGHALEYLEKLRQARTQAPEDAYDKWSAKIRTAEVMACITFDDEDPLEPFTDRLEARIDRILKQPVTTVLQPISKQVMSALDDMHHGLKSAYIEGKIYIFPPPARCPNYDPTGKEDAWPVTALRFPFLAHKYIPSV